MNCNTEFTLDEACFLGNEDLIKSFVPFDFSQCRVHPTRIAMATVKSICVHNCCDSFELAVTLLDFIYSRHDDIRPELCRSIITKLKQMAVLVVMATDINKEHSQRTIDKWFPTNEAVSSESIVKQELLQMLNNQQCCIEAMKLESNYSNELMTMLNEYFKAIEKKLPLPLKKASMKNNDSDHTDRSKYTSSNKTHLQSTSLLLNKNDKKNDKNWIDSEIPLYVEKRQVCIEEASTPDCVSDNADLGCILEEASTVNTKSHDNIVLYDLSDTSSGESSDTEIPVCLSSQDDYIMNHDLADQSYSSEYESFSD